MKKIYLFEPSIASDNTGDQIIVEGVKNTLKDFLNTNFTIEFPTHTPLSNRYALRMGQPDMKIICGSNILDGKLNRIIHTKHWHLGYSTAWQLSNSVFIGVGTLLYQRCNTYSKFVYKKMFHPDYIHSVRDEYTVKFLNEIGIKNVVNTGCPTMWSLTPEHCAKIPEGKSKKVVFTLTDYAQNKQRDDFLIKTLLKHYETVYFWAQGIKDCDYFRTLEENDRVLIIPPSLEAYNEFLDSVDADFVGTRLHGGMRALQKGHRTLIIGIDNRALEINKDTGLPVLNQKEIRKLPEIIESEYKTNINLNVSSIRTFLAQFDVKY